MHNGKQVTRVPEPQYECWVVGIDLGKQNDYTAIAAIQHTREPIPDEWEHNERTGLLRQRVQETFAVRGLTRLPLGMDYTEQGARIRQLLLAPPLSGRADLVIDEAGIGAPVCDQVVAHGRLNPVRVHLTGTSVEVARLGYRRYSVPKILVVSHLDARLSTRELIFADDLPERDALKDEMTNFQRHVTATGRSTFEGRSSKHDDIVLAIGFALWWCVEKRKLNKGRVSPLRGHY
jgi:hypothetical protein